MLPFQLPPCPNNDPTLQYLGRTWGPTISRQCARSFNGTNSEPFPPTKNRRLNNTRQCVLVNGQGSSLTVSFEIYQSLWGQEYPSSRDKDPSGQIFGFIWTRGAATKRKTIGHKIWESKSKNPSSGRGSCWGWTWWQWWLWCEQWWWRWQLWC